MAITKEDIVKAILDREPLDFSYRVFGTEKPDRPLYCPAVVKAFAEEEPADRRNNDHLTLDQFEALSLAARGRLLDLDTVNAHSGWSTNFRKMQRIEASVLCEGVIEAAGIVAKAPHDHRLGLQVIAAYIDGNVDLSHLDLPFSIRLISCAIDGAIRLRRTHLVSLDLCGSVVKGVFGPFLRTRGSVRLRRMMSTGVVDLGGAQVDDVFDASDAVVFPLDDPPPQEAFVGDRGIFNLSLSSLSNEARLMRARIYGGLTMKGCNIKRSLFLDDAILRAPIAFLERLGADVVESVERGLVKDLPLAIRTSWRAEEKLARELHEVVADDKERDLRMEFETLKRFRMPREVGSRIDASRGKKGAGRGGRLLQRLLMESPRARSSCLRADGMVVDGTIFARSIRSSGRLRLNYMRIGSSLQLDGARLRCSEDIAEGIKSTLKVLREVKDPSSMSWPNFLPFATEQLASWQSDLGMPHERPRWITSRRSSVKRERAENESYALDMRDARIGGRVSLKPDVRAGFVHDYDDHLGARVTEVMQQVCRCKELRKCQCGAPKKCLCAIKCECEELRKIWERRLKEKAAHVHCAYVNGQLAMDGATVRDDVEMQGILANLHNAKDVDHRLPVEPRKAFLLMEHCEIGGEVDLSESIGVQGIAAKRITIGSRLRFASANASEDKIERHALLLSGKIQLSDARIGGDATLLFDRDEGPSLLMARAKVGGRLHILPAKSLQIASNRKKFRRRALTRLRTERPSSAVPEVDLRGVHAAQFGHPDSAWPREDYLKIESLVYDQSWVYGPLTPRPRDEERQDVAIRRSAGAAETDVEREHSDDIDRKARRMEPFWWGLIAAAGVLALGALALWLTEGWREIDLMVGLPNALLFSACLIGWGVQHVIARFSSPLRKDSEPRAIYWLGLQRASTSVYKRRGMTVPMQPYVQAGKVLRSAGLILSANLLEADRLTRRNEQLSWRNNWAAKILLMLANFATKYGFDPLRTILFAVFFASMAGAAFHAADRAGYIRPTDGDLIAAVTADGSEVLSPDCGQGPAGCAAKAHAAYPAFSSLVFAIDTMVPGLDIGQERYWRAANVSATTSAHSVWFALAAPLVKIMGWLLTTAIAISLLTRIEAMIARHEE